MITSIFNNLSFHEKRKFLLISLFISLLIILELISLGLLLPIIKIIFSQGNEAFFNYYFLKNLDYEKKIIILLILLITSFK